MVSDRKFWFVRLISDGVAVGFYYADFAELAGLVDESSPPHFCEAAEIAFAGGIAIGGRPVLHGGIPDGQHYVDPEGTPVTDDDWGMTELLASDVWGDDLAFIPVDRA